MRMSRRKLPLEGAESTLVRISRKELLREQKGLHENDQEGATMRNSSSKLYFVKMTEKEGAIRGEERGLEQQQKAYGL
jgi:hypothetical protein